MRPGHQYLLSVWVKGSDRDLPAGGVTLRSGLRRLFSRLGAEPVSAQADPENLVFNAGAEQIGSEWQLLHLGPVTPTTQSNTMTFEVTVALAPGLRSAFFDNVLLKEVTSDVFVVENSWNTPQACDNPPGLPTGIDTNPRTEIGAMVGCSRYRVGGQQVTLRSFNRLCAQQNVGCQSFIDTANSVSPFSQRFNAVCSLDSPATTPTVCNTGGFQRCVVGVGSTSCRYTETANVSDDFEVLPTDPEDRVTVLSDRVTYLVDNAANYCSSEVAGCSQLGLPRINKQVWNGTGAAPAGGIVGWQSTYKVVNPDQFNRTLCGTDQLWCAAHRLSSGGSLTFRDPQGTVEGESRTCEYRTGVQVGSALVTGWFRTGSEDGCSGLTNYTLPATYDPSYNRYVGMCPAQYNGCTDYANPALNATGGQLHNYFLRSSVDSSSCNGLVDIAGGCMLFYDPSQPFLYSTRYSYPPNRLAGQPPVATSTLNTNVVLKVRRDRSCNQWYTCKDSVAVPGSATGQRVCTSLTSCTQLDPATNQCANPGLASFPTGSVNVNEFTFSSPGDSAKWRNLSGYTVPGILFSSPDVNSVSIGYSPYSLMSQIGLSAKVSNGDFEQEDAPDSLISTISSSGSGWHSCMTDRADMPAAQACTYVVETNHVAEGSAALRLSTTLNANSRLLHEDIALVPNTAYAISAQMNTVDLLYGEVRLDVLIGGTSTTLFHLVQGGGHGWQQNQGQFTAPATGNITLKLVASDGASGSAYIDEVKIEPVLQVNNQPQYVGQQCRVYPRGDAPSCRYTQTDGEYRGITGYCIQPDPRDPSRCVQWWPVDVVAGQSLDVFGETISLGSRYPLLYCTETTPNSIVRAFTTATRGLDNSGAIYENIIFPINDQFHWSYLASISVTKEYDAGGSPEFAGDFKFLGSIQNWTDEYLDDFYGFYTEASSMQVINNTVREDGFVEGGVGHGLAVGVVVDPDTGMVTELRVKSDTNDSCNGDCGVRWAIDFVLHNRCTVMTEVVAPNLSNTAWYSRFRDGWSIDNDLGYSSSQYADSYGASNLTDDNLLGAECDRAILPSAVGCLVNLGVFPPPPPGNAYIHGGTPYALNPGGEPGLMCTTATSNSCIEQAEKDACFADNGYCTGFVGPSSAAISGDLTAGASRLSQLFARSYKTWTPDTTGGWRRSRAGTYLINDCNDDLIKARMSNATGVDATTGCWDRRKQLTSLSGAELPEVTNITINNEPPGGEVTLSAGATVNLRFYASVDADRLPLRYIKINWGDEEQNLGELSINNQLFSIEHLYDDVTALDDCASGTGKCATIKIQIEDNWGFCNGGSVDSYLITSEDFRQDRAGCGSNPSRWTTAPTTIRFTTGGGGGGFGT